MDKKKKLVRALSLTLALLMVASLLLPLFFQFYAETPKEALDRINQQIAETQAKIQENKNNIDKQEQLREYYAHEQALLREKITALHAQIEQTKDTLIQKQKELENKVLQVADTKALFEERLRSMYIMRSQSDLSILLGVGSLEEMLRYIENSKSIAKSDTELIARLRNEQAELKAQAESIQEDLDSKKAAEEEMDAANKALQQSIQDADARISSEAAALQANETEAAELKRLQEEAQRTWQEWMSQSDVSTEYTGGQFMWPIPGYYTLSSDFGTRRLIYGVWDVHRGKDIPAPSGTRIYAAADGQVSTAAHWSYGTCVKLSHGVDSQGRALTTVYGHMSARAAGITDGVWVTQGQLIGYVGSTGNSTGFHLHFEVNLDGQPVSSDPYLKGTA